MHNGKIFKKIYLKEELKMLCDNCGKNEANVRYSENINGKRREMHLCEECSKKLGIIDKMSFNMSTDFSSFFGSLLEDFGELQTMPLLNEIKSSTCESCHTSFEDIVNTGRLGCPNCYESFSYRLDPILKRIQGANRHAGRVGKISNNKVKYEKINKEEKTNSTKKDVLEDLQEKLKEAIKEERYEEAAKIRDEIRKKESE